MKVLKETLLRPSIEHVLLNYSATGTNGISGYKLQ